jgi:hypothetical protein
MTKDPLMKLASALELCENSAPGWKYSDDREDVKKMWLTSKPKSSGDNEET